MVSCVLHRVSIVAHGAKRIMAEVITRDAYKCCFFSPPNVMISEAYGLHGIFLFRIHWRDVCVLRIKTVIYIRRHS